jgi:asparagine synthase (glutamine-hydrolysing)
MCGIAGWLSWDRPPLAAVVEAMTEQLAHRGPDHGAVRDLGPLVLGHRRLKVIDPSPLADQPFVDPTGTLWLVFNGAIYNFREIREELGNQGVIFRTSGDTEVILAAYRRWGTDCVTRFNGMFAFALWDENLQRLWLVRDRLGEKPLMYSLLANGGVAFASDTRGLRAHPAVAGDIDPAALGQYLALNYTLGERCLTAVAPLASSATGASWTRSASSALADRSHHVPRNSPLSSMTVFASAWWPTCHSAPSSAAASTPPP